ncbi:Eukaryotic translation initiation factor 3 subunit G [Bienertia sinuspersici]
MIGVGKMKQYTNVLNKPVSKWKQEQLLSPYTVFLTGTKQEENKSASDNPFGKGAVLMVCRTCGKKGDHWTSRCPYKDLAQPPERLIHKPPQMGPLLLLPLPRNRVRVINLSEDTREADLHELFSPIGQISRVYVAIDQKNVAIDQKTGLSRGFGFVNFAK